MKKSFLATAVAVLLVGLVCVGTSLFLGTLLSSLTSSSATVRSQQPPPTVPHSSTTSQRPHHNRHRPQRLGVILPFMGKTAADIPPYLELFCTGAVGAATVADFLLVHNGVLSSVEASSGACGEAPNVKFINLGSTEAFTQLLVDKLLDQVEEADRKIPSRQFVPFLAKHTSLFPYTLVEYKPAYGHIFGDYIEDYSHWAYSDLDVLWGDLGRHLTTSDWTDFDLITWGFGDQRRLYLRGQFTMHRNDPVTINQLWRGCDYLSRVDERFANLVAEQKDFRLESAEGCYSVVVLENQKIAVKYASMAWTDIDKDDTAHSHGIQLVRDATQKRHLLIKRESPTVRAPAVDQLSYHRLVSNVFYRDDSQPWQEPIGAMEPLPVPHDGNGQEDDPCRLFWIQARYRAKLCLAEALGAEETVYWVEGKLAKQLTRKLTIHEGLETGPFFHFQEWKRRYQSHQLAAILDPSWVTFLLTSDGGVPVQLKDPSRIRKRQSRRASPLGILPAQWNGELLVQTDETAQSYRLKLPYQSYCLQHGEPLRTHAVPCADMVQWSDESRVHFLSGAPAWKQVSVESDVTLCLTLDLVGRSLSKLTSWIELLKDNLDRWQGQPAVLVVSLQMSDQQQTLGTLQQELAAYGENVLVVVVLAKEDVEHPKHVSRRALMNMATDLSPTRWYICGIELERGLVLSVDSVVLAHRAVATTASDGGKLFWIAQFGLDEKQDLLTSLSLKDLVRARSQEAVDSPWRFDKPCKDDEEGGDLTTPFVLWWLMTVQLIDPKASGAEKRVSDAGLPERANSIEGIGQQLIELLQVEESLLLQEDFPILLVDNVGSYAGVRANTLVREVEAFSGLRCFNTLRMALLAISGYQIDVLEGAFAVSTKETRSLSVDNESTSGLPVKCDGCLSFFEGHGQTRGMLVQSEIHRVVNTVIVWENPVLRSE